MKILLPLLFFPTFLFSQLNPAFVSRENMDYIKVQASYDGMFAFEQNGKIGYMDKKGAIVIPAIYSLDSTYPSSPTIPYFYNGYAKVIKDKKYGLIDKTGKIIIPIEHESVTPYTNVGNFVLITKTISGKKNYGVLTTQNKELIPAVYEDIRFDTNMVSVKQNGKWGLIDKTGKQLLPCEFNSLTYSPTDKVAVAEKGTQYGVVDLTGKWLFEKSKSVFTLYSSKYGMVMCKVSGKYGFLDLKGNEAIISRYEGAYDFNGYGLAMVYKKKEGSSYTNVYGYVDKKGTEIIPVKYETLSLSFTNGMVYAKDPETNRYGYMDKTGKWILKPIYLDAKSFDDVGGAWVKMTDDKYHYINKAGKDLGMLNEKGASYQSFGTDGYAILENADYPYVLIDRSGKTIKKLDDCDGIYWYVDGVAGYKCKSNSKYGFVDLNGNNIASCEYDGYGGFNEGISRVEKKIDGKTKYGYLDSKGKLLIPVVYEWAQSFRNGWGLIKKENNYYFIDKDGNLKDPPRKYDELSEFRSGYALGKIKGTGTDPHTFYYINTQLKEEITITAWSAYLFWEDVAVISKDSKTYDLLNKKGEVIKNLGAVETLNFCSEKILAVREKGKWGFINDKGDVILQAKYDTCTAFKYGYSRVKKGNKWGIVDRSGTEIFEPKYENILQGENGLFIYFDKAWGVMDKTGNVIIKPSFYTMAPFEKDRTLARAGKTFTILRSPLAK